MAIMTFTVEAFDPPKEGKNYYDKNKVEYTYWVKFREFHDNVMVVKLKPSLQVGQELIGEIATKTSQKGNTYYRFVPAKQGVSANPPSDAPKAPIPAPAPKTAQTAPTQPTAPTQAVTLNARAYGEKELRLWSYEQAIKVVCARIAAGTDFNEAYDDLLAIATDAFNNPDLIKKVEVVVDPTTDKPTAHKVIETADLPNDSPIKNIFNAGTETPAKSVAATPPTDEGSVPVDPKTGGMPENFLKQEETQTAITDQDDVV